MTPRRPSAEALQQKFGHPLLSLVSPVSPWAGVTSIQGPSLSSFQYREIVREFCLRRTDRRAQTLPGGSGGPSVSTGGSTHLRTRGTSRVQPSPPVSTKGPSAMPTVYGRGNYPLFPLTGAQEPRGESTGLKLLSAGCRAGGPGGARSLGEVGPLSVHQGLHPRTDRIPQGPIPLTVSARNLGLC